LEEKKNCGGGKKGRRVKVNSSIHRLKTPVNNLFQVKRRQTRKNLGYANARKESRGRRAQAHAANI